MSTFHTDWGTADYFIPVVVYHDHSVERGMPSASFWAARDVAVRSANAYVRAFHPEHEPVAYVEPTTLALCHTHTRHEAVTAVLYGQAIRVSAEVTA